MSAWKYVMFQDKHGRHFPVIFPAEMVHADVAHAIPSAFRKSELSAGLQDWACPEAVSAGEIGLLHVEGVGGYSETIGVKAHVDDANIIRTYPLVRGVGFEDRETKNRHRKD